MEMRMKSILLSIFLVLFLVSLSGVSAEDLSVNPGDNLDNYTQDIVINDVDSIDYSSDVLRASGSDVYFNASALTDGDGTKDNPYNTLTASRLSSGCIAHFSNGLYKLNSAKTVSSSMTLIGENPELTIIQFKDGNEAFLVSNGYTLIIKNLTLSHASIANKGTLTANNVIFKDCSAAPDSYPTNSWGGAINSQYSGYNYYGEIYYLDNYLNLDNCTFLNNKGAYGGALYLAKTTSIISNCIFINNTAEDMGGAIACQGESTVKLSYSLFENDISIDDGGGAIYSQDTSLNILYSRFNNCSSNMGGAICQLNSEINIKESNFTKNKGKYDGGALYGMYAYVTVINSNFIDNNAINAGALFLDNCTYVNIKNSVFENNTALGIGGAIYSNANSKFIETGNTYKGNNAKFYPDIRNEKTHGIFYGNGNYIDIVANYTEDATIVIPSSYNLVEEGYVTPVRDQEEGGNCWGFAALAALESDILKANNMTFDFSEENLKNMAEVYSAYGWDMDTNQGGYDWMALGYLLSWLGPVNDTLDPYDDYSTVSPVINSTVHVQNVMYLTPRSTYTDNNGIKLALMKYGAVATSYYHSSSYYNSVYKSYYYPGTSIYYGNHAVTIVGWDDSYSKNNFNYKPSGNGAWIVKNSWNDDWGDDGYFYVSYYDYVFCQIKDAECGYVFLFNDSTHYTKNYQYDIAGLTDWFLTSKTTVYYQNIFTATDDDLLAAFGTYFNRTTDYTASVYVNGELQTSQSGHVDNLGYYTIPFNQYIPLKKGDEFKIVVKVTRAGNANFGICEGATTTRTYYTPGVSYFSYDGVNWKDLYDYQYSYSSHTYTSQVACLKAYTTSVSNTTMSLVTSTLPLNTESPLTVKVTDIYGHAVNSGKVIFHMNNQSYIANVSHGLAKWYINLTKFGTYDFSAEYIDEEYYHNCSFNSSFEVVKADSILKILVNDTEYGNDVNFIISLIGENGAKLNGNVKFTVLNNTYDIAIVNGYGNYTISKLLDVDSYDASASYIGNDEFFSSRSQTSFEVTKAHPNLNVTVDKVQYGEYVKLNINLTGVYNAPLNSTVSVVINNQKYLIKVVNGTAVKVIDDIFNAGDYIAYVSFTAQGNYVDTVKSVPFTVDKASPNFNLKIDNITYGDKIFMEVFLNHEKEIFDTYVQVTIGLNRYNVAIKNGYGNFTINKIYDSGNYDAVAHYFGTSNYNDLNVTTNFNINKIPINIDVVSKVTDISANISFNISENLNKSVIVNVDNKNYSVDLINGRGSLLLNDLNPGKHDVKVIFTDTNYQNVNGTGSFNIVLIRTILSDNNLVMYYKNGSKLVITLTDYSNVPISNKKVNIYLDGYNYIRTTDASGKVYMNMNLRPGIFNFSAEFIGDDELASSSINSNITILGTISGNNLVKTFKNSSQYYAHFLDGNGNPLANTKVSFNIDGVFYTRTTDSNGTAMLTINLRPGVFIITAISPVNGELYSNNITVLSSVNGNDLVKYFENGSQYSAKFFDSDGTPLQYWDVSFNIDGVFYTAITDENGIANLKINLRPGNFIITAINPVTKEMSSNSIKILPRIETYDLNMIKGDGSKFTARFFNADNSPVINQTVSFTLGGVKYNRITDEDGIASLNINLNEGHYSIISSDGTYSVSNKINVA